jgi:hypothetical protein
MKTPPNSFFRIEDNGLFYLSVGFVDTKNGPSFFDQAVLFCPFCGTKLQSKVIVAAAVAKSHRTS